MITDYTTLKQAVIDWSHRDDIDLQVPNFIDLAETEMYSNPVQVLKVRDGETRAAVTTSTSDRFASLPTGYQSSRKMRIQITNGESFEVFYRTPAQLELISRAGQPRFFTVTNQIEFDRISDQAYTGEMQYYAKFTALSTSNTTNHVLTNYPNIYLFGSLWALKLFADEPQDAANYYSQFINAIKGANKDHKEGRYGPAPVMRIEGATP